MEFQILNLENVKAKDKQHDPEQQNIIIVVVIKMKKSLFCAY